MITFKAKTASGEFIKSGIIAMNFPAGEAHTKLDPHRELEPTEIAIVQFEPGSMHDDLFKLAMWNSHILTVGSEDIKRVLIMPYFPGARQDRGAPAGLRVYAEFIEHLFLDQVIVLDPHSAALPECAPSNWTFVYSDDFLGTAINPADYDGVIAPDKGATERTQKVADAMGLPMFRAGKTRDPNTGALAGFHMEDELPAGHFLIVDDICDGGGTFIGLHNSIHDSTAEHVKLDLFVSHGVFSKSALEILPENFDRVLTTNSYNPKRLLPEGVKRIPLTTYLLRKVN